MISYSWDGLPLVPSEAMISIKRQMLTGAAILVFRGSMFWQAECEVSKPNKGDEVDRAGITAFQDLTPAQPARQLILFFRRLRTENGIERSVTAFFLYSEDIA